MGSNQYGRGWLPSPSDQQDARNWKTRPDQQIRFRSLEAKKDRFLTAEEKARISPEKLAMGYVSVSGGSNGR